MRRTVKRNAKRSVAIPITDPIDNVEQNQPLAEECVANVEKYMKAEAQTQLPKTDGTLLTKKETPTHIVMHGMLESPNHVVLSKTTSENDARTSEVVFDDPMMREGMKKRQRGEDIDAQVQPDPRQTNAEPQTDA